MHNSARIVSLDFTLSNIHLIEVAERNICGSILQKYYDGMWIIHDHCSNQYLMDHKAIRSKSNKSIISISTSSYSNQYVCKLRALDLRSLHFFSVHPKKVSLVWWKKSRPRLKANKELNYKNLKATFFTQFFAFFKCKLWSET